MARKNTLEQKNTRRLQKQLTAYSVAAGAVLALASTADAAPLIYSGKMNVALNDPGNPYFIDLDGDGNDDFKLSPFVTYFGPFSFVTISGLSGAQVGLQPNNYFVQKFNESYHIVPGNPANWSSYGWLNGFFYGGGVFNGDHGFIGIKFDIGANEHLGWIEYEGDLGQASGTIVSWAYEQNPVPLPGTFSLGLLALGAAGVARLRQRKKEKKEETA